MLKKPATVPWHGNLGLQNRMYNGENRKNYYKEQTQLEKHCVGPSMGIAMPLTKTFGVCVSKMEKQSSCYQRNNSNEGVGNCYISENSTARFQSQ
jgi:hypothetical protein